MEIKDGCATVTGYKPPEPLDFFEKVWEGGGKARNPKSGYLCGYARPDGGFATIHFSDKEKDETSPLNCFRRDLSNAFIRRFAESEGFFIFRHRAGLSFNPCRGQWPRQFERSVT